MNMGASLISTPKLTANLIKNSHIIICEIHSNSFSNRVLSRSLPPLTSCVLYPAALSLAPWVFCKSVCYFSGINPWTRPLKNCCCFTVYQGSNGIRLESGNLLLHLTHLSRAQASRAENGPKCRTQMITQRSLGSQYIIDVLRYWMQEPKFCLNFILCTPLVSPF